MVSRILVPTDGSAHAARAIAFAADLAKRYDAKVILLHALLRGHMPEGLLRAAQVERLAGGLSRPAENLVNLPPEIMARVDGKHGTQMPLQVLEFIGKRVLSGAEQTVRSAGVREVELVAEEGPPGEVVLDWAARLDIDLIVMGSRGLGGLKGLLLGSVSQKVTQLAKCPCLIIK